MMSQQYVQWDFYQFFIDKNNISKIKMNNNHKKRIGKYIIFLGEKLGSGAFADVFKGIDEETKEQVAIKVVNKAKILKDQYYRNALYSEIQISKKLKSPNIIRFYDVHETVNNYYIVLEFAQGGTLRDLLRMNKGKLQEKKVMKYLIQILNGFGQMAKLGIIHRDLKPQNVLIKDDILKIADFGFARYSENKSFFQSVVGTPAYMAPQICNNEKYTFKCDIWSLGIMTYEMIMGRIPWTFQEKSMTGYVKEINRKVIEVPENACSPHMRSFILGCLSRDEKARFDWQRIFMHPLFGSKFESNYIKSKQGQSQISFILANMRMNLHSKNINLNKILQKLAPQLNQQEFINFMKYVYKEISSDELILLYKYLSNHQGNVVIKDFVKLLTKYQFRLTGMDLSKIQMDVEEGSSQTEMLSSKRRYEVLINLRNIMDAKNINIPNLIKSTGLQKNDELNENTFGKLILMIDNNISQQDIYSLFRDFDTSGEGKLTLNEAFKGLCKIAEIVPMEQE